MFQYLLPSLHTINKERVNKLISVRPARARYTGNIGDLIVGRVTSIENKRWKVDIKGQRDASLQLSSVNLPGGAQRIRTYEDQLQMRSLFIENDLVSAEIQNIGADGLISLHTRNLKYGKLENGQLVTVPSVRSLSFTIRFIFPFPIYLFCLFACLHQWDYRLSMLIISCLDFVLLVILFFWSINRFL